MTTTQFRNTALHLIIDLSAVHGKDPGDMAWAQGFLYPGIGNLAHECGGFALMEEGSPTVKGSLGGISFPQWTGVGKGGRRGLFMAYCRRMKLHPYSYEAALGMIVQELRGAYASVVTNTLRAVVTDKTPAPKNGLMARVYAFERGYERAGKPHYAGRYRWAIEVQRVHAEWLRAGRPTPGPYIMPRARFTAQFDKEFGSGVGRVTKRRQGEAVGGIAVLEPGQSVRVNQAPVSPVETMPDNSGMPAARIARGRWPEQLLSRAEIILIQDTLRDLGYAMVGASDGTWNNAVVGAISALQTNAGIDRDGHYGPATRQALVDRVPEKVSLARATATTTTLKTAGEPVIVKNAEVKQTSFFAAIVSGFGALVAGVSELIPSAIDYVRPLREFFYDVPGFVWFALIAAMAAFLWWRSRQVEKTQVEAYRAGEINTLDRPPILSSEGLRHMRQETGGYTDADMDGDGL